MGSIRTFAYESDIGVIFHVKIDESNVEDVNDTLPTLIPGAYILPISSKIRYANYASDNGLVRRKIPVLSPANVVLLPATVAVLSATGGAGGASIVLSLKSTRGETFERAVSADTGQDDGDNP